MKRYLKTMLMITACYSPTVFADDGGWFVRPNIGISSLSDLSANADSVNGIDGEVDLELETGFNAGIGVGYQYTDNLSVELAWEYRTNDSSVRLDNGLAIPDGDYASNTFFLNGLYEFDNESAFKPYIGVGLAWIQEIDLDIESSATELSYSANGDTGFQLFGGVGYQLTTALSLQAELRVGRISGIELEPEEEASGSFADLDYEPTTFQLGLKYQF